MFYKLHEKLLLRGWQKLPNAVVDKGVSWPLFITAKEMEALKLCNGLIDVDLPLVPGELRELIRRAEKQGWVAPCGRGDDIRQDQACKLYPARYIRTAHWSITGHCNYRCKHCCMSAPDAKCIVLSHEQIMPIVDQLIVCGVMEVSLTGGEPLVRKDFMEIVDALPAGGIRPEFNMSCDGVSGWMPCVCPGSASGGYPCEGSCGLRHLPRRLGGENQGCLGADQCGKCGEQNQFAE